MDAAALGGPQGLAGAIDVLEARACQSAHDGIFYELRDFRDRLEIPVRRNRKSRFDDIDAHRIEQFGDFQFLFESHRSTRRLLAVAQRRVEYSNSFRFFCVRTHRPRFLPIASRRFDLSFRIYPLGARSAGASSLRGS